MRVDLHSHSCASDGVLPPAELLDQAIAAGLTHLAITDHDTMLGVLRARDEAIEQLEGIRLVPGVEVSCQLLDREVHLLGLGIDPENPPLCSLMRTACEHRRTRVHAILDAIRDDAAIAQETHTRIRARIEAQFPQQADDTDDAPLQLSAAGRLHLARWLIAEGAVRSIAGAFHRYLGHKTKYYRPYWPLPFADAVDAIHDAGGAAVLAHPARYGEQFGDCIGEAADLGIDGVELHHPAHGVGQRSAIVRLAEKYDLAITTGGSDFHDTPHRDQPRGHFGHFHTPVRDAERLFARVRVPWLSSPRSATQSGVGV